jgi:hypothetical protein
MNPGFKVKQLGLTTSGRRYTENYIFLSKTVINGAFTHPDRQCTTTCR